MQARQKSKAIAIGMNNSANTKAVALSKPASVARCWAKKSWDVVKDNCLAGVGNGEKEA